MSRNDWTDTEQQFVIDTHTTLTIKEQASALSRPYQSVAKLRCRLLKKGILTSANRAGNRPWSLAENDLIIELLQRGYSVAEVAARIPGRNYKSVSRYIRTHGGARHLRTYSEMATVRTLRDTALLFGRTDIHFIRVWIRAGWLKARAPNKRKGLRHRAWRITDAALQAFLAERAAWPSYDPHAITDPLWRELALDARAAAGGYWVKIADYARSRHYAVNTGRDWMRHGHMGPVRTARWGNHWYVWSEDLETFVPPLEREVSNARH